MPIAMLSRAGSFLACVAIWAALPQAEARAGTITFNDLTDVLTVADTTGRITSSVCTTTIADESCFVTVSAPANTVGVAENPAGLNVREPGGGPLSDVLVFFNFTSTSGTIQFVSDVEGGAVLDPVFGPFIDETGAVQDAASVTWTLADGSTVVDTIRFVSDVSEVPEPASGALLGIGIILGMIRCRRR
jgi:PEP-CTERM motif